MNMAQQKSPEPKKAEPKKLEPKPILSAHYGKPAETGSSPKAVLRFFLLGFFVLVIALLPALVVNALDPYQYLRARADAGQSPIYSKNERFQIPGLAINESYNACILGTSMIENTSEKEVSELFGVSAVKLPINASYITEQRKILDLAATSREKNGETLDLVIWNIDYRCLSVKPDQIYTLNVKFPDYMYDGNRLNDWKYLVNHSNLMLSFQQLALRWKGNNPFNMFVTDREILNTWPEQRKFGRDITLRNYRDILEGRVDFAAKIVQVPMRDVQRNIDEKIVDAIASMPETRFVITFPPKSILWYRLLDDKGMLEEKLAAQQYLLERLAAYSNAEVCNFQNDFDLTEDLSHYLDVNHYDASGNSRMVQAAAEGRNRVDAKSFPALADELLERVRSAEIDALVEDAKSAPAVK